MLATLIKQTNWSILGAIFGFAIGFLIKGFVVQSVGLDSYGLYIKGYVFITAISTIIAFGFPQLVLKFLPDLMGNNKGEAKDLTNRTVSYILISSLASGLLLFAFSAYIATYVFQNTAMESILQWSALYLPVILLISILTSLYRGVIRIKEIVVYGTFVSVTLRAILTIILFQYTNQIEYFIAVEAIVQLIVVFLLWWKFSKDFYPLKVRMDFLRIFNESKYILFAKFVFAGSVVTYAGSELLTLLVSLMLPEKEVGAYSLMLTITGISIFILINLNKVFAPIISKLYAENKLEELKQTYQKATFLINAITLPFVLLLLFFLPLILSYFGSEMKTYLFLTAFMFLSIGATLPVGSSGVVMNMAGMEKQNIWVQLFKASLSVSLLLVFVKEHQLHAVVIIYIFSEYFKNYLQVFIIWKKTKIHPFSKDLVLLYLICIPFVIYFIQLEFNWKTIDYFIVPILVCLTFIFISFKKVKSILNEINAS